METIGEFTELFATLDRWKVFKRKESSTPAPLIMEFPGRVGKAEGGLVTIGDLTKASEATIANLVDKALVQQFAPPSVIVNGHGDVVYIHGMTGDFLQPRLAPDPQYLDHGAGRVTDGLVGGYREAVAQDHPVVHKGTGATTAAYLRTLGCARLPTPKRCRA